MSVREHLQITGWKLGWQAKAEQQAHDVSQKSDGIQRGKGDAGQFHNDKANDSSLLDSGLMRLVANCSSRQHVASVITKKKEDGSDSSVSHSHKQWGWTIPKDVLGSFPLLYFCNFDESLDWNTGISTPMLHSLSTHVYIKGTHTWAIHLRIFRDTNKYDDCREFC